MKIKPVFVGIALLGALLLLLSLSSVGKVLGANPRDVLSGVKTAPLATKFLPQSSPMFVSFLVNPEKLGLFTQLAAQTNDRNEVRHELAELKRQLQQNWLLNYEADIQPWLDQEITLAITDADLDHQSANGLQTGYLIAFAAKDVDLAQSSMEAFWQRLAVGGSDLGFEQYQGLSILSTEFKDGKPAIAGTTLGNFVIFANDSRVLRSAIDTFKEPRFAIANLDTYQSRLSKLNKGKIAIAYTKLPQSILLTSFNVEKSGLRAKSILTSTKQGENLGDSVVTEKRNFSQKNYIKLASTIPAGSSVILGSDLGQTWQSIKGLLTHEGLDKVLPISIDSSDLAWAQNEFVIAILPQPNSEQLDWLLVSKVIDEQSTKTAIAELDRLARTKLTVGEIGTTTQPLTVWTKLSAANSSVSGNVVAVHTKTKDYVYLSNSLTVLESALTLKNNQSIAATKSFKNALAKLPKEQQTYAYIAKNLINRLNLRGLQTSLFNIPTISGLTQIFIDSPLSNIFKHSELISFAGNIANSSSEIATQDSEFLVTLK
ncbi:DUF3352 domain-containing protein [Pseudanabaena mucicola]|uniref:DUF3352 domain-containing protein n=1 Tax=Pseudanabaena mucicola FACHB-723 TaxID=2692860 RepID=A0ABR7ZW85_9CYAN|nr:DUF3352 domain-containing protein [Pseudanabaena mucicola]MBD2187812.1 DUF3352 domain-containing protein [Pseudanabaena mucicola FACHB-723]